jgi:hypothetical protein
MGMAGRAPGEQWEAEKVDFDGHFLKKLDGVGIANNTIIMYSTARTGGEADGRMASKGHA